MSSRTTSSTATIGTNHNQQQQQQAANTDVATLLKGRRGKGVWRPNKEDVERISWGKPARKKGTGSRGVPHRLDQDERQLFDQARGKGFLEVMGSAWRSERRDAPLLNTYRNWCDACAQPSIVLHKFGTGDDAVVVDLSPLRLASVSDFSIVAEACRQEWSGSGSSTVRYQGGSTTTKDDNVNDNHPDEIVLAEHDDETRGSVQSAMLLFDSDAWETRPIYHLPPYCIVWESLPRSEAKQLAKSLAKFCQTVDEGREKVSKKPVGVKPGKGRRHGGYGIG